MAIAAPVRVDWFEDLSLADGERAGGKGANLGELTRAGVPVPPGFVLPAETFRAFLRENGLERAVVERVSALDPDDTGAVRALADELQRRVLDAEMPAVTRRALADAYADLGRRVEEGEPRVAVRSSATAEDMPEASFAGMNETFLDIQGEAALARAVQQCWASLYGARVLFYRRRIGIPEERMAIAVIVQQMVAAESAGVLFTVNPATGDESALVIEGAFGLGDAVVSGALNPDHWEVDKRTLEIRRATIARKAFKNVRGEGGKTRSVPLPPEEAERPSLTEEQVRELAEMGRRIEAHYGTAQDIEWVRAGGELSIVQSRPVTATGRATAAIQPQEPAEAAPAGEPVVQGLSASPGRAVGKVRVLESLAESGKFQQGEVLVTRMTEPDWVPLMRKAAAIVTDEGGVTAHAAIVSRELGIPCIVGTREATQVLKDGETVTVDAARGIVYRGELAPPPERPAAPEAAYRAAPTATRLYVNLAQAARAEEIAARDVDGVGLLRIEFMVGEVTEGVHPRQLLDEGRGPEFRDRLAEFLGRIAGAFHPRPVICRASDFRSNEYREMRGGDRFEPREANPMLGYRGVFRYVREPDLFRLELEALHAVRAGRRLDNLHLMLPFVRTAWELERCVRLIRESPLGDDRRLQLWVMAEVPSILYRLEDYAALGVHGISIGSNDLTQLLLGVDRDSGLLAELFDERDEAVLRALRDLVTGARRLGLESSICGQAPSVYPDLTEQLVEWGIGSVSVNPDALSATRRHLEAAERRLLLAAARGGGTTETLRH